MDYVFQTCYKVENDKKSVPSNIIDKPLVFSPLHRGAFFPVSFPVDLLLWQSHKGSTGKETGKTHLCATLQRVSQHLSSVCTVEPLRFYRPEMSTKIAKTSR